MEFHPRPSETVGASHKSTHQNTRQNTYRNTSTLPPFTALDASDEMRRPETTTPKLLPPQNNLQLPLQPPNLPLLPVTLPPVILTIPDRPLFYASLCPPEQHLTPRPIALEFTFQGLATPFFIPVTGIESLPHLQARRAYASLIPAHADTDSAGVWLDLNCVAIETLPKMSQDEFTYLLRQLSPHVQAYKAWQEYAPREWRMTCPYCRDQIIGRPSDAKWSAEYTRHLTDGWCTGSEGYMRFMKGAVVEGGESIASGSGRSQDRWPVWYPGQTGTFE